MANKKFKLLLSGFFMILVMGSFAQSKSGYDIYDSSVITKKRMPQQNEFWNNSYDYPAKPRNQWEIGASVGAFNVTGDVATKFPTLGFGVHVRKALGYLFSLRLQYINGTAEGMSWGQSGGFSNNSAWDKYASVQRSSTGVLENRYGLNGPLALKSDVVFYNYKNKSQDLSLQGIFTLNNIRFHKEKSSVLFYVGAGVGATEYEVKVNALDENGNTYAALFNSIPPTTYADRKDVLKQLKDNMDDTYETPAQKQGQRRPNINKNTLRGSASVLAGVAFKLGKNINLALENRFTFINDDLLDGQQFQEYTVGAPVLSSNWDAYNYLSLGLNFNIGKNSVEPLYWLNPLDYAYSEINNPKHMKLPKPVYEDADGDGVIDQLDREPNTPAGCPVTTHGVSLDTDGDGVPDCKDKQLITPTECQPVDADGVGKCPDPECCKNMVVTPPAPVCPSDYPSVTYKGNAASLTSDGKAMLSTVAAKLKANPNCSITINGYPEASKASQAVCQKRLDAIRMYLVETQGISADRISTNCEVGGGDKNTVDIKSN